MAKSETDSRVHFSAIKYIHQAGYRLKLSSVSIATASVIYHKFFRENSLNDFDIYLISATSLYLAGKVEEEHRKIRDVVNVCYRTLHKSKSPLDIGETFWGLRDAIAKCELYILRVLRFKVAFDHPHKYLLHYLKALRDWFQPHVWEDFPLTRTCWSILRDSYHGKTSLNFRPQHIAVSIIYLSLQCYGLEVHLNRVAHTKWWQVFSSDLTLDIIRDIILDIIETYELETG
ncbi:cyclin-Q-like [Argonauta hians]